MRYDSSWLKEEEEARNEEICLSLLLSTLLISMARHWGTDPAADIDTAGSMGRCNPESDGHDKLGLDFVNLDWSS